jgi:hypothetical protein
MSDDTAKTASGLLHNFCLEAKQSAELVDVFRDDLRAETTRGIIVQVLPELVQIERYTDEGIYWGMAILRLEDVTRVRRKSRELRLVQTLLSRPENSSKTIISNQQTLSEAIDFVQSQEGYVVVCVEEADPDFNVIGEIVASDEDYFRMTEYGTMNTQDVRELVVKKSAVTRVDFDNRYDVAISQLGRKNKSKKQQGEAPGHR